MEIKYKPFADRIPDHQYQKLLKYILDSPETFLRKNPYQNVGRYTNLETKRLVYKFENGFPIITERKITFWRTAIKEIILFINGAHTLKEMQDGGLNWWDQWATKEKCETFGLEEGDLGPGSYGSTLTKYPYVETIKEGGKEILIPGIFNQVEHLVQSLKDGPELNRHIITTWNPALAMQHNKRKRKVVVAPCHGTKIQCTVSEGRKLTLSMTQCSGDVPIGVVSNIIQYAALTIMLAHVCGYEAYKYIHTIDDAQIYEDQMDAVKIILKRELFQFPTLQLTDEGKAVKNIFDFKDTHFELTDYRSNPGIKIPTTE